MLVLTTMMEKYTHKLPQRIYDWFLKNKVFERNSITGRLSLNFTFRNFTINELSLSQLFLYDLTMNPLIVPEIHYKFCIF